MPSDRLSGALEPKTDLSARVGSGEPDTDTPNEGDTLNPLGTIGQSARAGALVDEYHRRADERTNISHEPARGDAGGPAPEDAGIPVVGRRTTPPWTYPKRGD